MPFRRRLVDRGLPPLRWSRAAGLAALPFTAAGLTAFPPNPSYTVYGLVRDQVGATLRGED